MSCILIFEIEYLLESCVFYPVLPITRFKQPLFGGSHSKGPKNLKTYVFGRLFFDMQISPVEFLVQLEKIYMKSCNIPLERLESSENQQGQFCRVGQNILQMRIYTP